MATSLLFTNTNNYCLAPNYTSGAVTQWRVVVRFKKPSTGSGDRHIFTIGSGNNLFTVGCRFTSLRFFQKVSNVNSEQIASTVITYDQWHTLDVTWDNTGNVVALLDGVEIVNVSSFTSGASFSNSSFVIGSESPFSKYFVGEIEYLTFYEGGTLARDYQAALSGGTGSLLPDAQGGTGATLVNFPTDNSQWIVTAPPVSITNVDGDNTLVDGQKDFTITTTGFASDITTASLKVGSDTIALTGLTGTGDNYTADLMDVTTFAGGETGLPFSSANHQNEIEATNGTDTAAINITRNPKSGYAAVDVVSASTAKGSIFEGQTAPADTSQIYYPTANNTTVDAQGIITTDSTNVVGYVWDVGSGVWDQWTFSAGSAIPTESRQTWNSLASYLRTQGFEGNDNDVISAWLSSAGYEGQYNDAFNAYLEGEENLTGTLTDKYSTWRRG